MPTVGISIVSRSRQWAQVLLRGTATNDVSTVPGNGSLDVAAFSVGCHWRKCVGVSEGHSVRDVL